LRTLPPMGHLATDRTRVPMKITTFQSIFFGWKVVATAFVVATFTFGVGYYGPSIFLNILHQQRGWSVFVVAWAITLHFWSAQSWSHGYPKHHRFGIALITFVGVAALAFGMLCWSVALAPWQLFAAVAVSGAGWAATSGAAIIAMVSPWLDRRRSLALGHAHWIYARDCPCWHRHVHGAGTADLAVPASDTSEPRACAGWRKCCCERAAHCPRRLPSRESRAALCAPFLRHAVCVLRSRYVRSGWRGCTPRHASCSNSGRCPGGRAIECRWQALSLDECCWALH
jgi:hypothetical protein